VHQLDLRLDRTSTRLNPDRVRGYGSLVTAEVRLVSACFGLVRLPAADMGTTTGFGAPNKVAAPYRRWQAQS